MSRLDSIDLKPIYSLPIRERIALVQIILESIAAENGPNASSDAFKNELSRRVAAYRQNPDAAIPWEQVKDEMMTWRR